MMTIRSPDLSSVQLGMATPRAVAPGSVLEGPEDSPLSVGDLLLRTRYPFTCFTWMH